MTNALEPFSICANKAKLVGTSLPLMASQTWRIFMDETLKYFPLLLRS